MSVDEGKRESINEYYRRVVDGHVFIHETLEAVLDATAARIRAIAQGAQGTKPRVLQLGSHAGVFTEGLLARSPEVDLIVQDESADVLQMARERLAGRSVTYHLGPPSTIDEPVDIVMSIARHHHLPHDYLDGLRRALKPGGHYLLAEELCPEYCQGDHARRVADASVLHIVGGYVLTSPEEVADYEARGEVPAPAKALEELRQRALWRWYRHVVDWSVDRGFYDIAAAELQSARDDLVTGSDAEHKFSPMVVERQFALAGYKYVSKQMIGPSDEPQLQSMLVYEFAA